MQSKNYKDDTFFDYSLSLSDLILVDGWRADDISSVERVLFENGMDISHGWNTERVLHRNLHNKVVDTIRFCGVQRKDEHWKKVGMSLEDLIAATSDKYMKAELMYMSKQSNFSGAAIEEYGLAEKEDV